MNYFWSNVFDYFKDRRFSTVFFGTLFFLALAIVAGTILYNVVGPENLEKGFVWSLPLTTAFFSLWLWRWIAHERTRRRDRYKISPLSRDELRKARSKLMRAKS